MNCLTALVYNQKSCDPEHGRESTMLVVCKCVWDLKFVCAGVLAMMSDFVHFFGNWSLPRQTEWPQQIHGHILPWAIY